MALHMQHVSPYRLQIRQGGGGIALFGLPFLAAGIFMVLSVCGLIPIQNGTGAAWFVLALMSVPFTAVGAALTLGRSWVTADNAERKVVKQWGLLVPMYERTCPLDDYAAVTLGFVRGDSDTSDKFPIGLKGRIGADLPLCSFTTYGESWECAAELARHLRCDFEDATTDHPVNVSVDSTSSSMSGESSPVEMVARPSNARSEVTHEAGQVRLVMPLPHTHPIWLVFTVIPVIVAAVIVWPMVDFFRRSHTPDPIGWVFLAFVGLFLGILPLTTAINGIVRSRRGATIVLISREGVRVLERGAWRTRSLVSLDASDIVGIDFSTRESVLAAARRASEPLDSHRSLGASRTTPSTIGPRAQRFLISISRLVPSGGITVKTRRHGLTRFGQGLPDDEVRYLHSVVRQALTANS